MPCCVPLFLAVPVLPGLSVGHTITWYDFWSFLSDARILNYKLLLYILLASTFLLSASFQISHKIQLVPNTASLLINLEEMAKSQL